MMNRQRTILVSLLLFFAAVCAIQVAAWANNTRQPPRWWMSFPPPEMLRGLSKEEQAKVIEEWRARATLQEHEKNRERRRFNGRQAWTRLLRITGQQWAVIEPKNDRVSDLRVQARIWAPCGICDERSVRWTRPSSDPTTPVEGKSRDQMPEAWRAVEELLDVVADPNFTDQQVQEKIDALQHAKEDARKALPKARQELAAVLTTPREEAVFLLEEKID